MVDKLRYNYLYKKRDIYYFSKRDRLRFVHCPSEMIDQIGGWSNQKIGNNYGSGFQFATMLEYMSKLIDN